MKTRIQKLSEFSAECSTMAIRQNEKIRKKETDMKKEAIRNELRAIHSSIKAGAMLRASRKETDRRKAGIITARERQLEKTKVVDIDISSIESHNGGFFAWCHKIHGGGEVTSGIHGTKKEAKAEAIAMARLCWGNVNVIEED